MGAAVTTGVGFGCARVSDNFTQRWLDILDVSRFFCSDSESREKKTTAPMVVELPWGSICLYRPQGDFQSLHARGLRKSSLDFYIQISD